MYLYFDRSGTLKEIINDNGIRQGNSNVNKIYAYWEGADSDVTGIWVRYRYTDGTYYPSSSTYQMSTTIENVQIPFDKTRDLKYFEYYKNYRFYTIVVSSDVLSHAGNILASIWWVKGSAPITSITATNFAFNINETTFTIEPDKNINVAQWNQLISQILLINSRTTASLELTVVGRLLTAIVKNEGGTTIYSASVNLPNSYINATYSNGSITFTKSDNTTQVVSLGYDDLPTANSNNAVKSGGIKTSLDAKVSISDIVNNTESTSTTAPLSANMGKSLQEQVNNLKAVGRYLSGWDCFSGLATTNPPTSPYTYHTGDYFIVTNVSTLENYKPSGTQYVIGQASRTQETAQVEINDYYRYDGTTWQLEANSQRDITWGSIIGTLSEQTDLQNVLNSKQNTLTFDNTPTSGSNNPVTSSGIKSYVDSHSTGTWGNISGTLSDQTDLQTALNNKINVANPVGNGKFKFNTPYEPGNYSFAASYLGSAAGNYSVSFGQGCYATGNNSFADGQGSTASGNNCFAFGKNAKTSGDNQIVIGNFNKLDSTPLEIIANGGTEVQKSTLSSATDLIGNYVKFGDSAIYVTEENYQQQWDNPIITIVILTNNARTLDKNGNEVLAGSSTATSFIKTDGTSSQFLKADGSVDNNAYSTFSGSYQDLTDKPSIPTVNDSIITIQKNNVTVESFTLNQNNSETINISVPTTTSELTNNSGFIDNSVNNLTNYTTTTDLTALLNNKENADATILKEANIVNNVTSTLINAPLSANQGKVLNDRIDALESRGRYLSTWNCSTGLAGTNPGTLPYTYRTGDYYIISVVGSTNYKPDGSTYTGTASTTIESGSPQVNDTYLYDGTNWTLMAGVQQTVTFNSISGLPSDNANLSAALNAKQDSLSSTQLSAVNSGIISSDVAQITTNKNDITSINNSNVMNSGITSAKVAIYDGYATTKQDTIDSNNKLPASNVSGLSNVATSGDYDDLSNKPTIPTIPTTLPVTYMTTEPTSDNANGLIIVKLSAEPTTKYNGYIYMIEEA